MPITSPDSALDLKQKRRG